MPASRKIFFIGGVGVVALGLFVFFASKFFTTRLAPAVPPAPTPTPTFEHRVSPEVLPSSSPAVRVVPDQADSIPSVRYDGVSFSPSAVTVDGKGIDGACAVRIENKSREPLTIRLGPASVQENRGFSYAPIPTGQFLLIDPRYHLPVESFYSREHPMIAFEVRVEGVCR